VEFGIVTDELSQDPREAIELALSMGIRKFEIRNVRDARFPRHADSTLDDLVALREEYDVEYTAVSPGFFKCHLGDEEQVSYALGEGLELSMDFMEGCEIPVMICFGFELDTGTDEEAVAGLQHLADRLGERCFAAAVENETHCKFNTPERIAALLDRAGRPNLGANWDLGNLKEGADRGFPAGYELVKRHVVNVHAKDVAPRGDGETEWKPVGEGICDWRGQMRALARDGIVEHVTIESHCAPLADMARRNLAVLKGFLQG
jgi:sugar phosphate isomerase/epimerase